MPIDPMYEPYQLSTEYDITEILAHFDADYILEVLEDKLNNLSFASTLSEPNFVAAFEENFKYMNEQFPGDSQNIRIKREEVYTTIIDILTEKFGLGFNRVDDTIDIYTAAFYLYDFLVCNRNNHMVDFFTAFIINNKDSLYQMMNVEEFRKNKDSSSAYSKRVYDDPKYAIISANMNIVVNYVSSLDITLLNIFQSVYPDSNLVEFMDNAFSDKNNFFKNCYCVALTNPETAPIVITNIRLNLQQIVGSPAASYMDELVIGSSGGSSNG